MDITPEKKARIRQEKNFVIEENIDAVQWPNECSACGAAVEVSDTIRMAKKFKNFGTITSELKTIPYCSACFAKVKATRRLDKVVFTLALVFGIPLGLLLTSLIAKQPGTTLVFCGLLIVAGVAIAWGFFYLLIRYPIKAIFKNNFVEYIDAWLFEDTKPGAQDRLSVAVSIPRKSFAEKFATLNEVITGSVK
jgi:hypothetical protein